MSATYALSNAVPSSFDSFSLAAFVAAGGSDGTLTLFWDASACNSDCFS